MSNAHQNGKQPKSEADIRSSLESIAGRAKRSDESNRSAIDQKPGPLIDGLPANYHIVAGTFRDHDIATSFQELLGKNNIFSERAKSRQGIQIVVDAEDRHRAAELFQEHHQQFPDRRPKYISLRYDYTVFGIIMGLALSLIFFDPKELTRFSNTMFVIVPITFATFLGLIGHVFDRLRVQRRRTGKLSIGIWEFLILAMLPVIFILTKDLIPRAIFPESQ